MITKFEKRMIAAMLAVMMSMPAAGLMPVTAYAAETEETEADIQQGVSAVKEESVMQESEETENPGQEEQQDAVSSENQTGNDISDGTFIPIEEEEDESGQATEEFNQESEKNTQETERQKPVVKKAATATLSVNEPEEISLGENGEAAMISTKIDESESYVRYLFQPDETGAYYIDLLGPGVFYVYEELSDEYGEYEEHVDSASSYDNEYGSAIFEVGAGKTYYIDIYYDYDNSAGTVNWKIGRPQDVKPGAYEATISEPGGKAHYRLIYGESDLYYLTADYDVNPWIYLEQGEYYGSGSSDDMYETLDKAYECYISISYNDNLEATGTISWRIDEVNLQSVSEGEYVHTVVKEDGEDKVYKFVPGEDGKYMISHTTNVSIYNDSFGWIGNYMADLTAGETYYIVMENYVSDEFDWQISKPEEIIIHTGESIRTEQGENYYYKFVPEESGIYDISDSSVSIYDEDWEEIYGARLSLTAGETYYMTVMFMGTTKVDWNIDLMTEIEISVGKNYRVNSEDHNYYKFVPEESCEYDISPLLDVYDSEWNQIYDYNLTAGETYYLTVYSTGNFYFCIEKSKKIETEKVEIQDGGIYTTSPGTAVEYLFTPEETGRYRFWSEETARININDEVNWVEGYGFDYRSSFNSGETYKVNISLDEDQKKDVPWHVEKLEMATAIEETTYTTESGNMQEYSFAPKKSGYYLLASDHLGNCMVYDSEWNELNVDSEIAGVYDYIDEEGFGVTAYMDAGETYYIDIFPGGEKAEWKIVPLEQDGDYWYRTLSDGNVEILKYLGKAASVDIPESIDGKAVVSVGYGAFRKNDQLKSVTVSSKVTELQYGAFDSCASLQTVTFAEGSKLQSIGNNAFYMCKSLSDINLPDSVKSIENEAFYACRSLEAINFGTQLHEIEKRAFYSSGLKAVDIPDNVTKLGERAFFDCNDMLELALGTGLDGIPDGTFGYCQSLIEIEFPSNITYIGDNAFELTALQKVDIPDTVTSIGNAAFADCVKLQEVNIGNGTAYISDQAFSGCDLRKITISDKVQTIGDSAFSENENLESIEIPNSVTKIEYGAFMGCKSLMEIEIPDSVESIGGSALDNARYGNTAWYDNQDDGVVYAGKVLYKYKGEIPEGTIVTVEDGTKGIAGYAFDWQYGLKGIEIPNTVTNIGEFAFYGCELLTEIHIPQSVTEIGQYALGYLSRTGIKVPDFKIYGVVGSEAQKYAEENGFTFIEVEPEYVLGDVNADGSIGIADLRLMLRNICGKITLTDQQKFAADVEKDEKVTVADLRKMLRYICEKIDQL